PKHIILRRTQGSGSDRLKIDLEDSSLASIKAIVTHIDEPVSILLLGFHTKGRSYCAEYKIENAAKRVCDMAVEYVHFYVSMEGYPVDESGYLVPFRIEGKAREVAVSPLEKNMTISRNRLFECINVS
ncbi:MAG: hypothetical protein LBO76_05350, partial [Treponema sp.]|nr:hypothetical protein [Treponema sp.]